MSKVVVLIVIPVNQDSACSVNIEVSDDNLIIKKGFLVSKNLRGNRFTVGFENGVREVTSIASRMGYYYSFVMTEETKTDIFTARTYKSTDSDETFVVKNPENFN